MNTYADTLIEGILDGSTELESIEPEKELVKIGMSFARDAIRDAEQAEVSLQEAVFDDD